MVSAMNFSCCNDTVFAPTKAITDQGCDESVSGHSNDLPDFSLDQYDIHVGAGQGLMLASIQKPLGEVESVIRYGSLIYCRNRKARSHSSSYLNKLVLEEPLLYSPDKSILPVARDTDTWLATGDIVWVKAGCNGWWPSEVCNLRVLDGTDSQHTVKVLVQLFEFQERVWVDASNISQFHKCFEERSQNTSKAFKIALNQALRKYESGGLKCKITGEMQSPTKPDKSSDASKTSVSSSSKDDQDKEEGRGKRKRKTKIHFDEMAVPDNPARKLRRLKIMRLLGLAAPVGSPFSLTHRSS